MPGTGLTIKYEFISYKTFVLEEVEPAHHANCLWIVYDTITVSTMKLEGDIIAITFEV